jgi:membrane-bound metal-dependent hydrolase YbcI (DUF457 family)
LNLISCLTIGDIIQHVNLMYAIGHFALGYLTGKGSGKLLKAKLNMPLLLVASVIPDVDLILQRINPELFMHRGPTHSIITFTILMIPFFIIYRKQAIPYYAVLLSHSLLGDFFTGGIELFWPISHGWFGILDISVTSFANVAAEVTLFAIATFIMYKAKDLQTLLKPNNHNLVLVVAFGAVLGTLPGAAPLSSSYYRLLLVAPILFWSALLGYSMFIELRVKFEKISAPGSLNDHAG